MSDQPDSGARRHSVAEEPSLVSDPRLRAEAEARNGLRQFDLGMAMVEDAIAKGAAFRWRPSAILALHREALRDLHSYAGSWRPSSVVIGQSAHRPVEAHLVPELIEEMCDYLNAHRADRPPMHASAYVMWRLNWIHPFSDGNGRTSRMFSYAVLCAGLGCALRGTNTIPDQIVDNRKPYFDALEAADKAWADGRLDVSDMERLLTALLARQLTDVFDKAAGGTAL